MPHRFILQPYKGLSTRYHCPSCKHRDKTFVKYIDTETGGYINDVVGRCNRETSCGYHFTPKQYFQTNNIQLPIPNSQYQTPKPLPPTSFINNNCFKQTLSNYDSNNFVQYLINTFGNTITQSVLSKYFVGTSKHWQGATIFWQIDIQSKIRTGKIMLYNPKTGKRIKQPYNHITWVHSVLKQPNFQLKQCLFGEHLLKGNNKPVAIVESEKTSIIASVYLPQFIWLAVGSLSNLTQEKCNVLKGRKVVLFPDLNAFEKWCIKAIELKNITNFQVSNLLETKATVQDKIQGLDLADYLIRFNWLTFQYNQEIVSQDNSDKFIFWLKFNPNGGIFTISEHKFIIKPKLII